MKRIFAAVGALPLRAKVLLTLAVATVVLISLATVLSFRYWEDEALRTAEQQALLAALHSRSTVESALRVGSEGTLRRHLLELVEEGPTEAARVYDGRGRVVFSSQPGEEGSARSAIWIPEGGSIPRDGVVHPDQPGGIIRVFMPLQAPGVNLLEVVSSVAPIQAAMRRGATLGVALAVGSILALAAVLGAMLEREVLTPLGRVEQALASEAGRAGRRGGNEVREIEASVEDLVARQRAASREAERREGLAQVGELAAEMAHEFKRPLASIRSALDMFDQEYRLDPNGRAVMTAVNQQLSLLGETMQDLFSLARPVEIQGEDVQLREILDDALVEFAGYPGVERVEVVRDYGQLPPVRGDVRRLRQVFANLMVNALEAMPHGGTLSITTGATPDGFNRVTVRDTGPGIRPEELERIFLPFYSTKPQGTGLGLPLVARVVSAHGGRTWGESDASGTAFHVELPPAGSARPEDTATAETAVEVG
ncbi:MAG: ATP-binding protein [Longimicrobiales bacterium]|nr:ATP-binding protein [Longimicrobiales bacterium]